ncbi:MAG: helix-turn-helix domain-containing protein [Neomegalonema sp.]|nr:helix-turn-helix domain-containing protein [Neomegalonema sp.]
MQHLTQKQLAERWRMSPRTLEQWRWRGVGPKYLKLGGRVLYRVEDVVSFENARQHSNTAGPLPLVFRK